MRILLGHTLTLSTKPSTVRGVWAELMGAMFVMLCLEAVLWCFCPITSVHFLQFSSIEKEPKAYRVGGNPFRDNRSAT